MLCFPMICGLVGSKSRLAKAAGAVAREEIKNCTPLWREAHFQVKTYKTHQLRTTFWKFRCQKIARRCGAKHLCNSKCQNTPFRTSFGSSDIEKLHAAMARSTFPSQNVQNTPFLDNLWKLRSRKMACCCGAKHISKSKR